VGAGTFRGGGFMKKKPRKNNANQKNNTNQTKTEAGKSSPEKILVDELLRATLGEPEKPANPENGYNPETGEYWFDGDVYHEMDVLWISAVELLEEEGAEYLLANLDDGLLEPIPMNDELAKIEVVNYKKVLSNKAKFELKEHGYDIEKLSTLSEIELAWFLIRESAKKYQGVGYAIACLSGKFYIAVESFFNPVTFEIDNLAIMQNAEPCLPYHHACEVGVVADIGNLNFCTFLRYKEGSLIDWRKRFDQELRFRRQIQPDYDPYADPYDSAGVEPYYDDDE